MKKRKNQDNLLFIAQDTLSEIRENKKDQRAIFYNFIISIGVLFGLFEILMSKFEIQIPILILKLLVSCFALLSIILLIIMQKSLSRFRKRISMIWDDKSFKFAFKKGILRYKNDCKSKYYSFWNNFFTFTFIYILIIVMITIIIVFINQDRLNSFM